MKTTFKFILFILFLILVKNGFGASAPSRINDLDCRDTLYMKNGSVIPVTIIAESDDMVRFNKCNDSENKEYEISTHHIDSVSIFKQEIARNEIVEEKKINKCECNDTIYFTNGKIEMGNFIDENIMGVKVELNKSGVAKSKILAKSKIYRIALSDGTVIMYNTDRSFPEGKEVTKRRRNKRMIIILSVIGGLGILFGLFMLYVAWAF